MTVYAITDNTIRQCVLTLKKGEQGLRLLIFKLPFYCFASPAKPNCSSFMGVGCTLAFSDLYLGLQRRHVACLYLEILDQGIMMLYSKAYMKNTKLGSVQIYYSAYNKADVLEKINNCIEV